MYQFIVGEGCGAKEGGVVEQPLFDLQVTTPENIPESIEVDITELEVNGATQFQILKFLAISH